MPETIWLTKFLILLSIISLVKSQSCMGVVNDTNWIKIEGKCFLFVTDLMDYDAAIQKCSDEGGRLFEPKNNLANVKIKDAARSRLNSTPDFWIGVSDWINEGK